MWPTFEPGSLVVVTEEWRECLWSASPHRVVESGLEGLVTYQPAGTTSVRASNKDMVYTEGMSRSERKLAALQTLRTEPRFVTETPTKLYFYTPESWVRVNLGWDPLDGRFMGWYVNFELPARRTADGLVSKDLLLDIYVNPDHSWEWKDKDEFVVAIDRRIIDPSLGDLLLGVEAERVLAQAAAGEGAFDPRWQTFRAPAHWATPELTPRYSVTGSAWTRSPA
jgi:predicted RNA-binding protein associated with RNAse of E/G family